MLRQLPLLALALPLFACNSTDSSGSNPADLDPEAMMEMMMEFAAPAPEAKLLQPVIGDFTSKTLYWMVPGEAPTESMGTSHAEWILGGRFMAVTYEGDMMGMPFEGMAWMGYDKVREAYVSAWIDNFGTWMMDLAEGQASDDGKTITFTRHTDSPMGPMTMREVYSFDSDTGYAMDMYTVNPDGSEVRSMRVENTRR